MPGVNLLFYRENDEAPAYDWLLSLQDRPFARIVAAMERLADQGHSACRPLVENLGDGIYELRVRFVSVNYRLLYFFDGQTAVVVTCGFDKEDKIPPLQIQRAKERRAKYLANPENHHLGL